MLWSPRNMITQMHGPLGGIPTQSAEQCDDAFSTNTEMMLLDSSQLCGQLPTTYALHPSPMWKNCYPGFSTYYYMWEENRKLSRNLSQELSWRKRPARGFQMAGEATGAMVTYQATRCPDLCVQVEAASPTLLPA